MKSYLRGYILVMLLSIVFGCSGDDSQITNQDVLGLWHITAIHNSSPTGPTLGPNTGETIAITFSSNGTFNGTTSVNSFSGRFSTTVDQVIIQQMVTTEVADTPFGQAFYESFTEAMDSDTGHSVFDLEIGNSDNLLLQYQSFKFLNLQKP
nr:META domain-containing protein [Allomuricauda sp.]